ncbi:5027_t:CDS:2 [Cetraspora pellucida]|uniref:5027_t:CDS:1 n=1 Tax=Cetraspora pellucida TaxID=1433469 RepID=A0ACA9KW09_9GLOM|nr:5027_t:CDS:2 [Cetraspora pellucida]
MSEYYIGINQVLSSRSYSSETHSEAINKSQFYSIMILDQQEEQYNFEILTEQDKESIYCNKTY